MKHIVALFLLFPFFAFCDPLSIGDPIGKTHSLVGQTLMNHEWIVWLDNDSYWLIKQIKKRDRTWGEWFTGQEPFENQFSDAFYFNPGSWTEGSYLQVYKPDMICYEDYPYVLCNEATGEVAFARLISPNDLRLPKWKAALEFFDYPLPYPFCIDINLHREMRVIVLEDGPWYLFEVNKVDATWSEWWNNQPPEQPDHEFLSVDIDWQVTDPIQIYFRKWAETKACIEYGVDYHVEGSYLIENKKNGKLAYALPLKNKAFVEMFLEFSHSQHQLGLKLGYESGYKNGYYDGQKEGFEQGYTKGFREGQEVIVAK